MKNLGIVMGSFVACLSGEAMFSPIEIKMEIKSWGSAIRGNLVDFENKYTDLNKSMNQIADSMFSLAEYVNVPKGVYDEWCLSIEDPFLYFYHHNLLDKFLGILVEVAKKKRVFEKAKISKNALATTLRQMRRAESDSQRWSLLGEYTKGVLLKSIQNTIKFGGEEIDAVKIWEILSRALTICDETGKIVSPVGEFFQELFFETGREKRNLLEVFLTRMKRQGRALTFDAKNVCAQWCFREDDFERILEALKRLDETGEYRGLIIKMVSKALKRGEENSDLLPKFIEFVKSKTSRNDPKIQRILKGLDGSKEASKKAKTKHKKKKTTKEKVMVS